MAELRRADCFRRVGEGGQAEIRLAQAGQARRHVRERRQLLRLVEYGLLVTGGQRSLELMGEHAERRAGMLSERPVLIQDRRLERQKEHLPEPHLAGLRTSEGPGEQRLDDAEIQQGFVHIEEDDGVHSRSSPVEGLYPAGGSSCTPRPLATRLTKL